MKKVIIITISMLAVFSVLVGVSANQLTNRWQTPLQDEIELTASSPVEMVEKEYKEYPYILLNELSDDDSIISATEAVGIAGQAVEQIFADADFSKLNTFLSYYDSYYSESDKTYSISADNIEEIVKIDNKINYGSVVVEATTGKIKNLFFISRNVEIHNTEAENTKAVSIPPDIDDSSLTEIMTADEEKKVLAQALVYAEKLGYQDYKKYYIEKSISKDWGNLYTAYLQDSSGNIAHLNFEHNEGLKTTSIHFQNNLKENAVEYLHETIAEKMKTIS